MRISILAIASALAITLSAQSVTDNAIKKDFQGTPCEAIYNYIDESVVRHADGSTDHRVSFSLTLYTHTAMNSTYGQTFVTYNPMFQSLHIDTAYTVRRGGKRIDMPENAVIEVLPSWATKASDFNHLREAVIVHTGLDLGSTIHLTYTLHSRPGFNKNFDFIGEFDRTSPILSRKLTIQVPKGEKLRFALYGQGGEIVPNNDDFIEENRVITYVGNDIPARSRDSWQVRSVQHKWTWMTTLSDTKTELADFIQQSADPDITAWGAALVENEPDINQREKAVREQGILRHQNVKIPYNLVEQTRSFSQIKNCGYIAPWERAVLLCQMLNDCHIQASPAMVFPASMPKAFRVPANATSFAIIERKNQRPRVLKAEDLTPLYGKDIAVEALDTSFVISSQPITTHTKRNLTAKTVDQKQDYLILGLPANRNGAEGWDYSPWPSQRQTDIEIPAILNEADTFLIHVDKDLVCTSRIDTLITSSTGARLQQSLTHLNDSTLMAVRMLSLPKKIYNPTEYPELREILNTWISPSQTRLLFVRKH